MGLGSCSVSRRSVLLAVFFLLFPLFTFGLSFNNTFSPVSPTWHLINGSLIHNQSENDYESKVNATSSLSDDNPLTKYETQLGYNNFTNFFYQFNDFGQTITHDSSENDNDVTILPNALIDLSEGDLYALHCSEQNGGGARALYEEEFNINETDFTMGFLFDLHNTSAFSKYLIRKYEFPVGYYIYVDSSNKVRAFFRDSNGVSVNIVSTSTVYDDEFHTLVIRRTVSSGLIELILDGKVEATGNNLFGDFVNYDTLAIGTYSEGYGYDGHIDELFLTSEYVSNESILKFNDTHRIYDENKGKAIQVFFNKNINTTNTYSLKISKTNNNKLPIRIYSMENMTHINLSNYIDVILSEGINHVLIDSIIYSGYNYPLRFGGLHNIDEIYEVGLFEVGNDTTAPTISDCFVNDSFVDCNESVTWGCVITDDTAVSEAWGVVSVVGTPYTISQQAFQNPSNSSVWEVILEPNEIQLLFESINWSFDNYLNISLYYINATDVASNTAENTSFDPSIWNIYGCLICFEDWDAYYEPCLINDTRKKYYLDSNSCNTTIHLPADNGTYTTCNYCSENLEIVEGICFFKNGTYIRNATYNDVLYSYCCEVTGLLSDCSIDYSPYNLTTTEFCTLFNNTMSCDSNTYTEFGFFGDKTRWICYPPVSPNSSTHCMSYVKDPSSGVIQTNPNYITKTDSLISIDNEYEDRTSFEAVGNMVSVYFTKDNLLFDGREYVFGVRCTSDGDYYTYEQLITPEYENVNAPVTRFFWAKNNIVYIILGLLMSTIVLIFVAISIHKLRKG